MPFGVESFFEREVYRFLLNTNDDAPLMAIAQMTGRSPMFDTKWTIRGVDSEVREAMKSIHLHTGIPYGRLVSMALWEWIETLDMEDPVPVTLPFKEVA